MIAALPVGCEGQSVADQRRPSPANLPHGLWSLWDMLKFNAAAFYKVTTVLRSIGDAIGKSGLAEQGADSGHVVFVDDPIALDVLRNHARELQSSLLTLGTRQTSKSAHRFIEKVNADRFYAPEIVSLLGEIDSRLGDELSDVTLLTLAPKETGYFEPSEPLFGREFEAKFPSAIFELDEGAKCMGLGRSTAAVFHFMRLMEVGIRALARSLQIPDPTQPAKKNWSIILKDVKDGIEQKWPTSAVRSVGDGPIFENLHASLDAVKNPWRNATMHVENKYTDDEAEHIFFAVKGFMKKLSARMDENGDPKA